MKHYADTLFVTTANGLAAPAVGASVTVIVTATQTNATIYSDDGVTTTPNPLTTDGAGRYAFFVADGRYDLKFSGTGFTTFTTTDVDIHDVTDITAAGKTPIAGNLQFTGSNTHAGTETFSGSITSSGASFSGAFAGAHTISGNVTFSGVNSHSGVETFSVQPVITPATNQLLLGTSPNQTTVNFPAPVGNVTIGFPNTADTIVGRATTDTLTNKTLTSPVIATIVNVGTLTLPSSTDTLVGRATTDTLTNKTLTTPTITNPVLNTVSITGTPASANLGAVVASGTSTLSAAAVATVACAAAVTTVATGAATTDAIEWAYASAPTTADGLMVVQPYVTAGNVNFLRCNPTAASQTGTALVINWRILR